METPARRNAPRNDHHHPNLAALMSPIPEDKEKLRTQQQQQPQQMNNGTVVNGSPQTTTNGTSSEMVTAAPPCAHSTVNNGTAGVFATAPNPTRATACVAPAAVPPTATNPTPSTTAINGSSSTLFAGPYRLLDTLGKGGLATVKVGVDFSTGHKVAVKIVDKTKLTNPREQVSMAREITIMKLLKHQNILRLYDVFENQEKIFLILDLLEGGDLYGHLTRYGAMRPSEAVNLFRQIIKGVAFCHKNLIIHRDLKPENLLLSTDKKSLVLSDFGLSTGMAGSRNLLKTRCGTIHYISPEVARGDPYVGTASDVWSCGIILFAMVTATLPFDGDSSIIVLKKIVKGEFTIPSYLPSEVKDLINKMLELDPSKRITIPEIKKHTWFKLGASKEDLQEEPASMVAGPYTLTEEDLIKNKTLLENLKLLGWEDDNLIADLLHPEMNQAKVFFKLLLDHKQASRQRIQSQARSPCRPANVNSSSAYSKAMAMTPDGHRPRASSTDTHPTRTPLLRRSSKSREPFVSTTAGDEKENQPCTTAAAAAATAAAAAATAITAAAAVPTPSTPERNAMANYTEKLRKVCTPRGLRRPATVDGREQNESTDDNNNNKIEDSRTGLSSECSSESSRLSYRLSKRLSLKDNSTATATATATAATTTDSTECSNRDALTTNGALTTREQYSSSRSSRPRQRAATVGDGQRPDVSVVYATTKQQQRGWDVSPSSDPNSKIFMVESKKSINQILENLRICFDELDLELSEKKQKKDTVKLKGRLSVGKAKKTQLIVEVKLNENGGNTLNFKKAGKTTKKEDFTDFVKKIEETLIV